MTTLILGTAAALLLVVALVVGITALRQRRSARSRQRQSEQQLAQGHAAVLAEQERVRQLTEQQHAWEDALGYLASAGLDEAATAALTPGGAREVEFVLPQPLAGTAAARRVEELVSRHTALVRQARDDARATVDQQVTQVREEAREQVTQVREEAREEVAQAHEESREQVAQAHEEAREATRAAVLTFASALVSLGAELAEEVSTGVRRHQDDEAYATLMAIDHTSQQMLRIAQGYMVLSGGTLGRRLPATTFTDVARAAMGRIQNYERVRAQELDQAVVPRAVEALVHTLAILLDNAVRYAPPTSYAEVSFRTGHNGVTVLVDDAGLQMSEEQLDKAREILTGKQPLDIHALGAYPQTGFRVAAQLAARYGFRIDIDAPNLFGGTRALVFVPTALLTSAPPPQPAGHLPTRGAEQYAPTRSYAAPPSELPHQADASGPAPSATTASGLTRRRRRAPMPPPAADPTPYEVRPGRPDIAAAWADGTRRARTSSPDDRSDDPTDRASAASPETDRPAPPDHQSATSKGDS